MAKITALMDFQIRTPLSVLIIKKEDFISVSEEMAIYLCNEDIELMSDEEKKHHKRSKHAVRTSIINQVMPHTDYTNI